MLSFINRVSSRSSKTDVSKKDTEISDSKPVEPSSDTASATAAPQITSTDAPHPEALLTAGARASASIYSSDPPQDARTDDAAASTAALSAVPATQDPTTELKYPSVPADKPRRLSWRPLSFIFLNSQDSGEHKHTLSLEKEQRKKSQVAEDKVKRAVRVSSADKKAKESAFIVRSLIIGPFGITIPNSKVRTISKPKAAKVKAQLSNPKSANRVIAQLRTLPSGTGAIPSEDSGVDLSTSAAPIHAVCLPCTDAEAEEKHFAKLKTDVAQADSSELVPSATGGVVASVYNSSLNQLHTLFLDMEIVSLFTAPDLGLGQGGDGVGILSGALPTAKTVLDGVEQITPQLLALGYATGKSILPDHTGIHPPTDRMSVLTYWWGFELALPPPSIEYLSNAPSIAHTLINILTALSAVNGGVREMLPFVRYISQYVDTEFNMIKQQDRGKGVVCAATWLVPFAIVPRPWDFTPAPAVNIQPAPAEDPTHQEPTHSEAPASPPQSPSLPPSRPASPPTLLPPLALHETGFGETRDEPDTTPPVDETAVDTDDATITQSQIPAVAVVPATPTASAIKSNTSDETLGH